MSTQSFRIAWEPVAKGRPRFASRTLPNGRTFVTTRTPQKTRVAEASIRFLLEQQHPTMYGAGIPLEVEATFVVKRPKSAPKKRRFPAGRPDLDNFYKLLCDAANDYLWADDAQVVRATIEKRYATEGESAHIEIRVTPC